MRVLKMKDIQKMNEKEIDGKIKELKLELIKKKVGSNKEIKGNPKEIKKAIARLLTLKKINKMSENKK